MPSASLRGAIGEALMLDELTLNVTLNQCEYNANIFVLNLETNDVHKEYYVVKVSEYKLIKQLNYTVLPVVFSFQINNNQNYVGFERKSSKTFTSINEEMLDVLENILRALSKYQADILNNQEYLIRKSIYNVKKLFSQVISNQTFEDFNEKTLERYLSHLDKEFGKFIQDTFVTESISFHQEPSIMPPVYDFLLYIFSLTDELFRQYNFVSLIHKYFDILKTYLNNNLSNQITKEYEETSIRLLLPIVKAEILSRNQAPEDLRDNLLRYLKYPLINQEDIYEIINNEFESAEYKLEDYDMEGLMEKNGHLGDYYYLNITVKVYGEERHLNLFVKVLMPPNDFLLDLVKNGPAQKEDFFYNILIPLFKENGLENYLDFAPKCYLSRLNWMTILSNLTKQGFTVVQINDVLDYHGLKAVALQLAKFSAITLILEEKLSFKEGRRIQLSELYPQLVNETILVYEDGGPMKNNLSSTKDGLCYILELFADVIDVNIPREELARHVDVMYKSIFLDVRKSDQFKNVIVHGDLYLGNMLFRYGEESVIDKGILVDFQVLRYMPPGYELLFLLYLSCSRTVRLQHYDQLIQDYYQEISDILHRFQFDVEQVFPRQSFDDSLIHMKPAALYMSLCYSWMSKIKPKLRESLFRDEELLSKCFSSSKRDFIDMFWSDEDYRNAMADNARDLIDFIKEQTL